jgi:hypothetical protein
VARRERKLRETVSRAGRCLDDLSTGQRRVLTLRAGVGAGPPRSRALVARRLDISVKRVVRLERTGLRRLRSLAARGGCAPATTTLAAATTAPSTAVAPNAEPEPQRRSEQPREPKRTPSGGTGETGGDRRVAGVSQTNPPEGRGINVLIGLILLSLLLAAILVARMRRREATPVAAAPVEEKPVWIPWRRSTMTGPSWNEKPPPSREESWAESPSTKRPVR